MGSRCPSHHRPCLRDALKETPWEWRGAEFRSWLHPKSSHRTCFLKTPPQMDEASVDNVDLLLPGTVHVISAQSAVATLQDTMGPISPMKTLRIQNTKQQAQDCENGTRWDSAHRDHSRLPRPMSRHCSDMDTKQTTPTSHPPSLPRTLCSSGTKPVASLCSFRPHESVCPGCPFVQTIRMPLEVCVFHFIGESPEYISLTHS